MFSRSLVVLTIASSSLIGGCGASNLIAAGVGLDDALTDSGAVQNTALVTTATPEDQTLGVTTSIPAELSALFGRAAFFHEFDNNPEFKFIAQVFYSSDTVTVSDTGTFAHIANSTLFSQKFNAGCAGSCA